MQDVTSFGDTVVVVVTGVGLDKYWSSSRFLQEWEEHARRKI